MRKTSIYAPKWAIRRRRWKFWLVVVPLGVGVLVPLALIGDLAGEALGRLRRWEDR